MVGVHGCSRAAKRLQPQTRVVSGSGYSRSVQLRLLGPLEVVDDQGRAVLLGGPKQRQLFTVLATQIDQPVSEARLSDALWGDEPPPSATKTLQAYVARLRKALGSGAVLRIESVESGYVLRCGPGAVGRRWRV